jgi:Na+-translocating ferredoxin:NAD+ oxidoreductase subunit C
LKPEKFFGGIHPPGEKELSADCAFESLPLPDQVILPLSQHLGARARLQVEKGSQVVRGMMIAAAEGIISAPIHTPVSGKVISIRRHSSSGGFPMEAVTIQTDPHCNETAFMAPLTESELTPDAIRERVAEAGIVGQGGAGFPTAAKLHPPSSNHKPIHLFILNGCECEPYLTRDYRIMLERPGDVLSGLRLMMKTVHCEKAVIAIEDNKPLAGEAMRKAAVNDENISVMMLKTLYPQGAEKMLVQAVTGRRVPPGKLPFQLGIVVVNSGTAASVHDAVYHGLPAISAAITVSGRGIRRPANLLVPVGTPFRAVLDYCGGMNEDAVRVVSGGPMMGIAQYDLDAPVLKATSGILVLTEKELSHQKETACLKCGQCVEYCPMGLSPTLLVRLIQSHHMERAAHTGITQCMECGSCAYTCPAHIPLVQWLRLGKQWAAHKHRAAAKNEYKR